MADAKKGIKERYTVLIKSLTYKGYEIGDVPIIWWDQNRDGPGRAGARNIYNKSARAVAHKFGFENIEEKFEGLLNQFNLDINAMPIPEGNVYGGAF